ncbi:MAG TPA: hypothetical protein VLV50_14515 [Stellaceae bacterium]|nr:hypothetical protein [Stellaceae bacterium]
MSLPNDGDQRSVFIHPVIYRIVLALAALLIVSAWWGFAGPKYQGLVLVVVTLLVVVTATLYGVLRHIGRRRGVIGFPGLRRWLDGDFVSNTGQEPAREAMLELLLPILSVSVGMLIFAIVLHLAVPGA